MLPFPLNSLLLKTQKSIHTSTTQKLATDMLCDKTAKSRLNQKKLCCYKYSLDNIHAVVDLMLLKSDCVITPATLMIKN